jgi:hypothetical protein
MTMDMTNPDASGSRAAQIAEAWWKAEDQVEAEFGPGHLDVKPVYIEAPRAHYAAVVRFTAGHGPLEDSNGERCRSADIPLDELPALIARLQDYVDEQAAAGDAMVNGWTVER